VGEQAVDHDGSHRFMTSPDTGLAAATAAPPPSGLGYRFLHYSDAALYGTDTIGAEFHMLEVSWRY
jgi:hypothetical protein